MNCNYISQVIELNINGKKYSVSVKNKETLLEVLREKLNFLSVKEGCGLGECGACTVILNNQAVNACLVLAVEANRGEVITVEGLSSADKLHPIQKAFVEKGAVQCGFCTPGMIMSTKALLDNNKNPDETQIKKALSGNICRCTGYVKILEAVKAASQIIKGSELDE